MVGDKVLRKIAAYLPGDMRSIAKKLYYRNRHWAHPKMKGFGTVQDMYYWTAGGSLNTLLLLQNYFSALYPNLDTDTDGTVTIYDPRGEYLGEKSFSLKSHGFVKFRISSLLEELEISSPDDYGTVEVHISIPRNVLAHIQAQKSVYFCDRLYIGYENGQGQACFVHGVDRTNIYHEGRAKPIYWYGSGKDHDWAPEIPLNIEDYDRFSVILINRSGGTGHLTLTISDVTDNSLSWNAEIPPRGVHRFQLNRQNTAPLVPTEMRMRVSGMTTQYGRPVVFKEFPNGAISAMHC